MHTLEYRRLIFNEDSVIYLGYPLKLTVTELAILRALYNSPYPLTSDKISLLITREIDKSSLAFHIFNINKKAKAIGNRPLIKNLQKTGYFLNGEM